VGKLVLKSKHRLLCGSTANTEDVTRLMVGNRASCVFTDPPYGVAIGAKNRMLKSFRKAGSNLTDIVDDATTPEELKERLLPAFVNIRELVMANDCTLFVTAPQGGELGMMMMMMMKEAGLATRHVLIWKKNQPTFSMGRLDYDYAHEPILLTWGKKHKRPMGGEHRTSVWCIDRGQRIRRVRGVGNGVCGSTPDVSAGVRNGDRAEVCSGLLGAIRGIYGRAADLGVDGADVR
jgi:hypothetical protein